MQKAMRGAEYRISVLPVSYLGSFLLLYSFDLVDNVNQVGGPLSGTNVA